MAILISEYNVLTNAHCVNLSDNKVISIILGDWNIDNDYNLADCKNSQCADIPKEYEIGKITIHEDFSRFPIRHDIALIRLKKAVEFSNYIQPICLPENKTKNYANQQLIVAGWQRKSQFNEVEETRKLKINVTILSDEKCLKTKDVFIDIEKNLCAICNEHNAEFSSGAALMGIEKNADDLSNYYLIGLLSQGFPICNKDFPDVFVRIDQYLDWINHIDVLERIKALKALL